MAKEAYSRAVIDQKLKDVGWNILDESQVVFEDHGDAGRADYVLMSWGTQKGPVRGT